MSTKIVTETLRFTSVKPSPERVQQRAQSFADLIGGTVVSISPLKVGKTRKRSTCWDTVVKVEVSA